MEMISSNNKNLKIQINNHNHSLRRRNKLIMIRLILTTKMKATRAKERKKASQILRMTTRKKKLRWSKISLWTL
jgi:hypothetical protein